MDLYFWAAIATIVGTVWILLIPLKKWWAGRNVFTEEEKEVTMSWFETSEQKKEWESEGYIKFYWSRRNQLEERKSKGYAVMYEYDKKYKIKYKFVTGEGSQQLVLIGTKENKK